MTPVLYFAYGSNLSTRRLLRRTPSARAVTRALLRGHQLRWHKKSADGSGKADAWRTGSATDVICGVLFALAPSELSVLDEAESVGVGYDRVPVEVVLPNGLVRRASTYVARIVQPGLRPYRWYKRYVVSGAREHGLPVAYVRGLEAVAALPDPDSTRAAKHARSAA